MDNHKDNPTWENHKNQNPPNESQGSKQEVNDPQTPDNRLKDGTNDLQNGDQEPTSERSSDLEDQSSNS